ncbi:MAG TPA: hypothetical protein PLY85_10415, partial [Anaerolineaceae bacterium]|nr:hypothetical protein [Anaerolineaceae bacterium]
MSDWDTLKASVLNLLGDSSGQRYSDAMLEQAALQALRLYSSTLPQLCFLEIEVPDPVDEVTLAEAAGLSAVISASWFTAAENARPVPAAFTWSWSSGTPYLRFTQMQSGRLRIVYSASQTLEGLMDAAATSVPPVHFNLLAWTAAGYAMQLRADIVREAYGAKSSEAVTIAAAAEKMILHSHQQLDSLRYNQVLSPEWSAPGWQLETIAGGA